MAEEGIALIRAIASELEGTGHTTQVIEGRYETKDISLGAANLVRVDGVWVGAWVDLKGNSLWVGAGERLKKWKAGKSVEVLADKMMEWIARERVPPEQCGEN